MKQKAKQHRADKHSLALRAAVSDLLRRCQATEAAVNQSRLVPRPADMGMVIVENQATLMRSLAFLIDEVIADKGEPRSIHFKAVDNRDNGQKLVRPT